MGFVPLKKRNKLRRWMAEVDADNPVGMWVPGVNQSGTTLRSCSPGWAEKVRRSAPISWWRNGVEQVAGRDLTVAGGVTLGGATGPFGDDPTAATTFDGTDDSLSRAYAAAINPVAAVAVGVWFKRNGGHGSVRKLYARGGPAVNNDMSIDFSGTNTLRINKQGVTTLFSSTQTFTDTNWHFAVCMVNGTAGTMNIDGVAETPSGTAAASLVDAGGPTYIGSLDGASQYFVGDIGDVIVWDRIPTADEIADLYLAGKATHVMTPVGGVAAGLPGGFPGGSQSLDFNGTSGYMTTPFSRALNPVSALSFEAWFHADVLGAAKFHRVLDCHTGAGFAGYRIMLDGTNAHPYGSVGTGGSSGDSNMGAGLLNTTDWFHAAVTHDGTTRRTYLNGVAGASSATAMAANASQELRLGLDLGSAHYLDGQVSGVAIYRSALSATRVLAHYNAGR